MPSFKLHTQEQKKLKGLGRVSEKPRAFSKVTFDISKALSKHILIKDRKNCKSYPSQVIIYQVYISGMTCLVPSVPSVLSVLRVPSVLSVWSNVRSIQPTTHFFLQFSYLEPNLVHPTRRQNFAGKLNQYFYNIWDCTMIRRYSINGRMPWKTWSWGDFVFFARIQNLCQVQKTDWQKNKGNCRPEEPK